MGKLFNLSLLLFISPQIIAQSAHSSLRAADKYYVAEDYNSAELLYRKADESESSLKSNYNLGNSLFQQERFEEAVDQFQRAVQRAAPGEESSNAYYNLGNAYINNNDIEQAIQAYKTALIENPYNSEAQYNLIVCKEILKQQQQEKQCNNPQPSEDGEKQEEQDQDKEQEEQQEQEKGEEGEESESQEQQEEQQDSSQIQQEAGAFDSTRLEKQTLDSLDAVKLLEVIQSEEQKVQERLRKYNSKRKIQEKDW